MTRRGVFPRRWAAIGFVALLVFLAGVGLRKLGAGDGRKREPSAEVATDVDFDLSDHPEKAPRAALAAARDDDSPASELAMIDVAVADQDLERVFDTGTAEVSAAVTLERDLLTSSDDGKLKLWRRSDGALLGQTEATTPVVAFGDTPSASAFVAAVGRDGALELVDIADPGRPRVVPLGRRLEPGEKPLAVAFSEEDASEVVAIGSGGEVLRVDPTTGALIERSRLDEVGGRVPWVRGGDLELVAARFVPEVSEDEEGVLVGTAGGGVADVDLGRDQGKTELRPGLLPGRILSLDRVPYGKDGLVVGTTSGMLTRSEGEGAVAAEHPSVELGDPVPAVALEGGGEVLWAGGEGGVTGPDTDSRSFSGPPVRAFGVGHHGPAAINREGRASVLSFPGTGMTMGQVEATSAVAFDPHGDLLVASGIDPNHTEKIRVVRPRPPLPNGEEAEDEVRSYEPDPAWWSGAEDPNAFYVNDVVGDGEYVAAAGQDPYGNAAVVVWDAASGRPLHELKLGLGGVTTELPTLVSKVMLLPGRHQIAAYSVAQQLLAVWSTETWELEESIPVGSAGDLSLSPDESTIAVVGIPDEDAYLGEDEQQIPISFVDLDAGKVDHTVDVEGATAAAFAPDGSSLAVSYGEGAVQLRSPDGREVLSGPIELGYDADELAWRPTGGLLAASIKYGGVVLVDPADGTVSRELPHDQELSVLEIEWSPDGHLLATQTGVLAEDGDHYETRPTEIWTLGAAALRRRMCELAGCRSGDAEGAGGPLEDLSGIESVAFVFLREGDLYAADDEGHTARIGQLPEYPGRPPAYDWSDAGFAWSAPEAVGAILPGDRRPRTWPCACAGVAWSGKEIVSVATDGSALVHIDPDSGSVRATQVHGLPANYPDLLGVVGGRPIIAAYLGEPDRSTFSRLFEIEPDGRAVMLARDAQGVLVADEPSSSPDTLALVSSRSGGACFTSEGVVVVSARPQGGIRVERPPAPIGGRYPQVRSVQVAADGSVSAAFAPIGCTGDGVEEKQDSLAERYVLTGHRWQPTGETGFDVQAVGDGAAILRRGEKWGDPGRLVLTVGERETEVAPAAEDLVAAP